MIREVSEETGLSVLNPGHLLYVMQHYKPAHGGSMIEFCFAVSEWRGTLTPRDLDEIAEARFFPPDEAITILRSAGGADWSEPLEAYLQGGTGAGVLWLYRQQQDGNSELVSCIPAG